MAPPQHSSRATVVLILISTCIASTTLGYDGSMMNGLNILPSYTDYFKLTPATEGLNTAALWIGGVLAAFPYGPIMDRYGRKPGLYFASFMVLIGVILQAAAQNIAMFTVARIWIGFSTSGYAVIGPAYVAETLPPAFRAYGLGILFDLFYFGGLVAAGITYGTAQIQSTWAWRLPSLLQGVFALISIFLLPFIPESPRFLQMKGRTDDAITSLAQITSDGDIDDPRVAEQMQEIANTLAWEKEQHVLSGKTILKTPSLRKRLGLMLSVAAIVALSGNNIVSYYFGTMLDDAGITSTNTQLLINVILNIFCLICALAGTWASDKIGRKPLALISCVAETIFLLLVGILTKFYGTSSNTSGIYATVAMIFMFQGSYSFAWTPLNTIYPPEVLNYSMRAFGLSLFQGVGYGLGLVLTFIFPIALDAIGWKLYIINAGWDVLQVIFVAWYWVETKGHTLESIDKVFVGDAKPDMGVELGTAVSHAVEDSKAEDDRLD